MPITSPTRRSVPDILLAAEAFCFLSAFRMALAIFPVRRILRAITPTHAPTLAEIASSPYPIPQDSPAIATALRVRWAIEAVTRNSPAAFVCFPQTLAGYTMLRLRHVSTTMVYGVARSPEPEAKLIAHTWLTLGDRILLGGEGSAGFTPLDCWA